jgi:cystathionine gamma-synthase
VRRVVREQSGGDATGRERVLRRLDELGIAAPTVPYPAHRTVNEGRRRRGAMAGTFTKNLLLRDKKGRLFLFAVDEDRVLDLRTAHTRVGASGRLGLASPERMREVLGVEPGALTLLALVNDEEGLVTAVVDAALLDADQVNVHPLVNTESTGLRPVDLLTFIKSCGPRGPDRGARHMTAGQDGERSTSSVTAGESPGLSTVCVHGGDELDALGGLHTPLYNHSTFGFPSTAALLDVVEGRTEGNLYTRYGLNPTIRATERKLALLEGGELAFVFSSGMAAEAATFLAHCRNGDHIVCIGDVYGGTYELLADNLPNLGIETTFLLVSEIGRLREAMTAQTRLVFFENPTNPNLEVVDIAAVAAVAKAGGALTVADTTFASPVNQNPLRLGADLVIHATTKYLGGHSDLTGGVVIGPKALVEPIRPWRKNLGQMMAPEVAYLLARSLRTLVVRVRQQNATAQAVAEFLQSHPKVLTVHYPGLPDFPGHAVAREQMKGFGGMVTFVHDGDAAATAAVVDQLRLFTIAPSLGGAQSLVCQPVTLTHHDLDPAERTRRGIVDGMVRLSCGLEDAADLVADLRQALA